MSVILCLHDSVFKAELGTVDLHSLPMCFCLHELAYTYYFNVGLQVGILAPYCLPTQKEIVLKALIRY